MALSKVQEIETAIESLSPLELDELYGWLDERLDEFETRIKSDLQAGRLDNFIDQALAEEAQGLITPL